jgi:hypothetical protein
LGRYGLGVEAAIGAIDDMSGAGGVVVVSADAGLGRAIGAQIHAFDLGFRAAVVAVNDHPFLFVRSYFGIDHLSLLGCKGRAGSGTPPMQ